MTATLDLQSAVTDPLSGPDVEVSSRVAEPPPASDLRVCPWPIGDGICGQVIPKGAHHSRIYCDEHKEGAPGRKSGAPKRKDEAPKSVKIEVGLAAPKGRPAKPASDQARVEAACVSYLQLLAGIFVASGDDTCAATVAKATPQIARAIADLSKYHPQLVKILAPVEATGEGAAWIALSIAVFPVVVGILSHHGLLDQRRSEILGTMSTSAEMFARSVKPEDEAPNADPAPAAAA